MSSAGRVASGTRENVKCEEGWTAAEKAEKCPRQHAKQEFVVMMRVRPPPPARASPQAWWRLPLYTSVCNPKQRP